MVWVKKDKEPTKKSGQLVKKQESYTSLFTDFVCRSDEIRLEYRCVFDQIISG